MDILGSVYFGKYYFEVALVLRSSLLLSSLLLNSEAWVNLSEKDIRGLEQTDEILLSRILEAESNTSNTFKYLELGIMPVRFEIMKRTIIFLQYILKQEKTTMIHKVFKATCDSPIKKDFVSVCQKYLKDLKIELSFSEIEKMGNWNFKNLVKEKTKLAAFEYLIKHQKKQTKIDHIEYFGLEMQEYLLSGNKNTELSKVIFKARSNTLDVKINKRWKYEDVMCIGCQVKEESGEELMNCESYGEIGEETENISYKMFYGESNSDMFLAASKIKKRLKRRQVIMDND